MYFSALLLSDTVFKYIIHLLLFFNTNVFYAFSNIILKNSTKCIIYWKTVSNSSKQYPIVAITTPARRARAPWTRILALTFKTSWEPGAGILDSNKGDSEARRYRGLPYDRPGSIPFVYSHVESTRISGTIMWNGYYILACWLYFKFRALLITREFSS